MSPPDPVRRIFIESSAEDRSDQWVEKASRGEEVVLGDRRAFIGQSLGLMDIMARPGDILTPTGAMPPTEIYRGPNATWNGRAVPVLGTLQPPASWMQKTPQRSASGVDRAKDDPYLTNLRRVLAPTDDERRRYWLALYGTMKSMNGSFTVVPRAASGVGARRDAGAIQLVPIAVGVVVVFGVVAIVAYAIAHTLEAQTRIREDAETARHAADIQAAAQCHAQRIQYAALHPNARPDDPALQPCAVEERIRQPPASGGPSTLDQMIQKALDSLTNAAIVGGGLLVGATVLPPVLANIADRATRERHG